MDPSDSGQGKEERSEQNCALSPSSRGRERKKNPKYFDYETKDVQPKRQRRSSERGRGTGRGRGRGRGRGAAAAATNRTPPEKIEIENANNSFQQTADEGKEATDITPQICDETATEETPKKVVKAKRTTPAKKKSPAKRTPKRKYVRKTPVSDGIVPTVDGAVLAVDKADGAVENGTPKPKKKYIKKGYVEVVSEPPPEEPEEEIEPGGRRRRGAAKVALKYLQNLSKEVFGDDSSSQPEAASDEASKEKKGPKAAKVRKGQKRKRDQDSDAAGDEDFVPSIDDQNEEMDGEGEGEALEYDSDAEYGKSTKKYFNLTKRNTGPSIITPNGLNLNVMKIIWEAAEVTKKFREEHHSSWVFPEWVPSTSHWHPVPESDLEKYLPQELQSAAFRVNREGLSKEQTPLQRLDRFSSVSSHKERWDSVVFTGGPVWALEWCPTPDGAPASQYMALSCHRGMDDQHYANKTYSGSALVQLWDMGKLEYNSRPNSQPSLAYGLAQDKGFVWHLKWCPAGGWEPPNSARKAPFLPRLGLLAVAYSTSVVTIYSLPHPQALHSNKKLSNSAGADGKPLPIYKAEGLLTLKLGSFKAPRNEKSGQVLSMDWLPKKPHNIIAIGFYDGIVGLWDLFTKSSLLRVRESDASLSLLPYRCLLAHDHAVRALAFCPASRFLLVTAGEDRYVKTWDLRRLCTPVTIQKRNLTTEVCWPLNAPGLMFAQENAYAANGSHGVHYFDHSMTAIFAIPRTGNVWSLSYTDWLNGVMTSDSLGEVILALLPHVCYTPQYFKRTIERRYPVFFTDLGPCDAENGENEGEEEEKEEEERDAVEEQDGLNTEQPPDAASEPGDEGINENRINGGKGGKKKRIALRVQTYKEVAKTSSLQHVDSDMRSFTGYMKRTPWKRMQRTELNAEIGMDDLPLAALHKVRFNPNMCCHTWFVCGGQSGLVRLMCLKGLVNATTTKILCETQEQFNTLYSPTDQRKKL